MKQKKMDYEERSMSIIASLFGGTLISLFFLLGFVPFFNDNENGLGIIFTILVVINFSIINIQINKKVFEDMYSKTPLKSAFKQWALNLSIPLGVTLTVYFFMYKIMEIWQLGIILLILTELVYWFDKKKPKKKESKFKFAAKIKGISLGIAVAIEILVLGLYNASRKLFIILNLNKDIIVKFLGYIGITIVGLIILAGLIYGYIWLNSLKYRK